MGMSIPHFLGQLDIRKGVVGLATGAGFIYLLYKAIKAGINCQPPISTTSPICIARLAVERERHGRDSGELRRLLNSLECKQDEYAKSMILHSITRCVYLLEAEASACTVDDINLVGSMLDDKDNSVKIQALNTLKAFSGIRKFRLTVQEHSFKVLELISTIWDSELHIAGLRLLNNLPLPDYVHPQLRRVMPALMEILQSDYILAQVQAIRLLSYLAQKNDLLYDILNCQTNENIVIETTRKMQERRKTLNDSRSQSSRWCSYKMEERSSVPYQTSHEGSPTGASNLRAQAHGHSLPAPRGGPAHLPWRVPEP
uniref:Armadillo repeat containing 12 n=1 Tax=Suricata suricatta TaxID=37032 RepID=A0A673SQA2_SURSU